MRDRDLAERANKSLMLDLFCCIIGELDDMASERREKHPRRRREGLRSEILEGQKTV